MPSTSSSLPFPPTQKSHRFPHSPNNSHASSASPYLGINDPDCVHPPAVRLCCGTTPEGEGDNYALGTADSYPPFHTFACASAKHRRGTQGLLLFACICSYHVIAPNRRIPVPEFRIAISRRPASQLKSGLLRYILVPLGQHLGSIFGTMPSHFEFGFLELAKQDIPDFGQEIHHEGDFGSSKFYLWCCIWIPWSAWTTI